jgi:hypothetical protein
VGTLDRFHFYSGSSSSAGKYLSLLDSSSVSYNKWRNKLDALDSEMPEKEWIAVRDALAARERRGVAKKG